jgi:hypothetical protein
MLRTKRGHSRRALIVQVIKHFCCGLSPYRTILLWTYFSDRTFFLRIDRTFMLSSETLSQWQANNDATAPLREELAELDIANNEEQ